MSKEKIRAKYLKDRGGSVFNVFNTNDYTRFLEAEILNSSKEDIINKIKDKRKELLTPENSTLEELERNMDHALMLQKLLNEIEK